MRKSSLKNKITFNIAGIVLVVGVLAISVVYIFTLNRLVADKYANLELLTLGQAKDASLHFDLLQQMVENTAKSSHVVDFFAEMEAYGDEVFAILQNSTLGSSTLSYLEESNVENMFSAIYLMDASGLTYLSTDRSFVGNNYGFRDYFQSAVHGQSYIDVSIGVTSGELGYYFSCPVYAADGHITGVIVFKMRPDVINTLIAFSEVSEKASITLVDEYGVVVHSSNEDFLYRSIGSLTDQQQKEIVEKKRYGIFNVISLGYDDVQEMLNRKEDHVILETTSLYGGEEKIISIARLPHSQFSIVVIDSLVEYTQFAQNIASLLGLLAFIAVLFEMAVVYWLVARSLKPLEALHVVVNEVRKGDLSKRAIVSHGDEVGALAASFNAMIAKLEELDQAKSEFISLVSHQLRTPLTVMRLYLEQLHNDKSACTKEWQGHIDTIANENKRLITLIDRLLDTSRLEHNVIDTHPEKVKLPEFLQEIVTSMEPLAKKYHCSTELKIEPNLKGAAMIDPLLLREVLANLLSNAYQYGKKQGGRVVVELAKKKENNGEGEQSGYVISVTDNGIGIPEESQVHIFERFYRAPNAVKYKTNHSGVGLYMVKKIVEATQGRIWFTSKEGVGSSFSIFIPSLQVDTDAV